MLPNIPLIPTAAFNHNGRLSQILKLSLAVVGLGLAWRFHLPLWELLSVVGDREAIAASLDQFGILAPLLLGVILILQVIVAAIPGHALRSCYWLVATCARGGAIAARSVLPAPRRRAARPPVLESEPRPPPVGPLP